MNYFEDKYYSLFLILAYDVLSSSEFDWNCDSLFFGTVFPLPIRLLIMIFYFLDSLAMYECN